MSGIFYRRHFIGQLVRYALGILMVLLLIAISVRYRGYLADAVQGSLSVAHIFPILLFRLAEFTALLLPLSLLIALMIILTNMHSAGESHALRALGAGPPVLAGWAMSAAVFIGILSLGTSLYLVPTSTRISDQFIADARYQGSFVQPKPFAFVALPKGSGVAFVQEKVDDSNWRQAFFSTGTGTEFSVIMARELHRDETAFALTGGTYYRFDDKGLRHSADYKRFAIRPDNPRGSLGKQEIQYAYAARPLAQLIAESSPASIAEIQWRLCLPLMVILVAYLAVPLAQARGRTAAAWRIVPGIVIFLIYFGMLSLLKSLVEQEILPTWPGIWLGHIAMLLLLYYLWREQPRAKLWATLALLLFLGLAALPS